ncbi:AsmA family protein [Desulforhopalus singaporensis]|uniref:AsmA family protein n=2 Tax=Desulforhopalus singaporensis TaxID=91360 RepID=A0A1H0SKD7_9BACT|nr:AsmA family protein [Desulforhopalus singaporensis]
MNTQMKKACKIAGWLFTALTLVVAVGIILPRLVGEEQCQGLIAAAVGAATGQEVSIEGSCKLNVTTAVTVTAEKISISGGDRDTAGQTATADRVLVQVALSPLLRGVVDFIFELDGANIVVATNNKKQPSKTTNFFFLHFTPYIRKIAINDLSFTHADHTTKGIDGSIDTLRLHVENGTLPLSLQGTYRGAPIALAGTVGHLRDWVKNRATAVALKGSINGAHIRIVGTAGPLSPWPAGLLNLHMQADNLGCFTPFFTRPLPSLHNLSASLVTRIDNGTITIEDGQLLINDQNLSAKLSGSVAGLIPLTGMDFAVELASEHADKLFFFHKLFSLRSLPPQIFGSARVTGDIDDFVLTDLTFEARDHNLDARLSGQLAHLPDSGDGSVQVVANLGSTAVIGDYAGRKIPSFGPLDTSAAVAITGNRLRVSALQAKLSDPSLSAEFTGTIDSLFLEGDKPELSGIAGVISATSPHLAKLADNLGITVPMALPASASIKSSISGDLHKLNLDSMEATVKDNTATVHLSGSIGNVYDLSGLDIGLRVAALRSSDLTKFTAVELPELGWLRLEGEMASHDNPAEPPHSIRLRLDGETVQSQITATAEDIASLARVAKDPREYGNAGVNIFFTAAVPSLAKFAKPFGVDLPELGEARLDGHLRSSATSLQLISLNTVVTRPGMRGEATAAIADLLALREMTATISAEIDSLSSLSPFIKTELPKSGPWSANVVVHGEKSIKDMLTFSANVTGREMNATLEGHIIGVSSNQQFQSRVAIEASSLQPLNIVAGREIPIPEKLRVTARSSGGHGHYRVDEFQATAGQAQARGDFTYSSTATGGGRSRITGRLQLSNLDTTPLFSDSGQQDLHNGQNSRESKLRTVGDNNKIFSSRPFATGLLQQFDIDLDLELLHMTVYEDFAVDTTATITVDRGLLTTAPFTLTTAAGGTGGGWISFNATSPRPSLDVQVDFKDLVLPKIGGKLDLKADLHGSGKSVAEVMGSLDGHFVAGIADATISKSFFTRLGQGLLTQINPAASENTTLECAIVRFDAENGMVDFKKKIAAQTTEATWIGGGEINLTTEQIDIGASSKARNPLDALTKVTDLASLIHIGGTLGNPQAGINIGDVARKYAEYTAFIATGGLSFLAGKVVGTIGARKDICERILEDLAKE